MKEEKDSAWLWQVSQIGLFKGHPIKDKLAWEACAQRLRLRELNPEWNFCETGKRMGRKLSDDDVQVIRRFCNAEIPPFLIAKVFGVSYTNIITIRQGKLFFQLPYVEPPLEVMQGERESVQAKPKRLFEYHSFPSGWCEVIDEHGNRVASLSSAPISTYGKACTWVLKSFGDICEVDVKHVKNKDENISAKKNPRG